MKYLNIDKISINNGIGIRVVLWVSGCSLHCKGCQNPESWSFENGKLFDDKAKEELFEAINKSYINGITLSGGHPLEPENIKDIYFLLRDIKNKFPKKDIWLYTGYTLDISNFTTIIKGIDPKATHHNMITYILNMCDFVVDGEFQQNNRDITLPFRGSSNQRIINVKETIEKNEIVLYKYN